MPAVAVDGPETACADEDGTALTVEEFVVLGAKQTVLFGVVVRDEFAGLAVKLERLTIGRFTTTF